MGGFHGLGDRRRQAAARRDGRAHTWWVFLQNDAADSRPQPGERRHPPEPVNVLQQQRSQQQVGSWSERTLLDVVLNKLSYEPVLFQPFAQTCEENWIEVRACQPVPSKYCRVQEVEHLPRPGSGNGKARAHS